MKHNIRIGLLTLILPLLIGKSFAQSQSETNHERPVPLCSSDDKPYRDFDFVVGEWEMFDKDGKKVGEQSYVKREQGCLITEEWTTTTGGTGHGMTFVDPSTGLWRQVYVSPLGQIDYSGGIDENGSMVLEGTIHPTDGKPSAPIRGIWTKQDDGSIEEEFLILNSKTNTWFTFYYGIARKKK
ncbi:MAG: hypothetical protein ABJH05_09760 [Fulvivirga sp.]